MVRVTAAGATCRPTSVSVRPTPAAPISALIPCVDGVSVPTRHHHACRTAVSCFQSRSPAISTCQRLQVVLWSSHQIAPPRQRNGSRRCVPQTLPNCPPHSQLAPSHTCNMSPGMRQHTLWGMRLYRISVTVIFPHSSMPPPAIPAISLHVHASLTPQHACMHAPHHTTCAPSRLTWLL